MNSTILGALSALYQPVFVLLSTRFRSIFDPLSDRYRANPRPYNFHLAYKALEINTKQAKIKITKLNVF